MFGRQHKEWIHYRRNIIASDIASAILLESYQKLLEINRIHTLSLEVFDLQRYKLITQSKKVQMAVRERATESFIFIVCRN